MTKWWKAQTTTNPPEEAPPTKKVKWTEMNKRKILFICGCLLQLPFLFPNFCLWLFYFLWLFVWGVKLYIEGKFWVSFILSWRKVKGKFLFPWEWGVFNTGSGSRAPLSSSPPFLFYFITGAWGPARVYLFSILTLWKWKIRNFHPLFLVLMAKPRPFWTMNRGWRFGCALRMFRLSASPPC